MTVLSLQEAAEQTGRSKVDIWRAIQAGALSAQRIDDGGFAIDPAELFRVFESPRLEPCPTQQDSTDFLEALGGAKASPAPEAATATDMDVAFAALQAELRGLLGPLAVAPATGQLPQENDKYPLPAQLDVIADKAPTKTRTANVRTETPIPMPTNEEIAEPPCKRPWWRRLGG